MMRLIKAEDVCEMLDIIADSKAITTKKGAIDIAKTALDDIPTIDPESLHPQGEWINEGTGWDECWKCSACKEYFAFEYDPTDEDSFVNYCPHCGAKMKGGDSR